MFTESNRRMKKILQGGFKQDEIAAAQREFEGQIKLLNTVVSAYGIASKNKRALTGLERMNIMDDTTAIDLGFGDREVDKVKCPEHDKLITRAECLDYSGEPKNVGFCSQCDIGKATKRLLLPEQF